MINPQVANKIGEETFQFFTEEVEKYGLTFREGQLDMACEIVDGMKRNLPGIIEAGVGIGKSFAYLVPLLLTAKYHGGTMVVSTSTIVLQNQLMRDIDKVQRMLGTKIPVFNIKGQNNYVCTKRLNTYCMENFEHISDDMRTSLLKCSTQTQINTIMPEMGEKWEEINVAQYGSGCSDSACKYSKNGKCLYSWLRGQVRNSGTKIVICNHDILIADLKLKKNEGKRIISNDIEMIVIDEAHHIEEKVRNAFTKRFQPEFISRYITALSGSNNVQACEYPEIEQYVRQLQTEIREQIKCSRYDDNEGKLFIDIPKPNSRIIKILNSLYINHSMKNMRSLKAADELYEMCMSFFEHIEDSRYLFWLDITGRQPYICYAPKNIAELSSEIFFSNKNKCIFFTSGTLTDSDGFNGYKYFAKSIGFPMKGILYEKKPSPYNNKKVHFMVPKNMDVRTEDEYRQKALVYINSLIKKNHGNTLILFTSIRDMMQIYDNMDKTYPVFIQNGKDDHVLESYKNTPGSVLLSTNVWEGFDVKGEKLSQVIIYKLPFPVPDPVIQEKCDNVIDKMYGVLFPEMMIKLKQGCGRLIRSEEDSGNIIILDSRAAYGRDYSSEVLKSLPYELSL